MTRSRDAPADAAIASKMMLLCVEMEPCDA
jgi:hypothetical protein